MPTEVANSPAKVKVEDGTNTHPQSSRVHEPSPYAYQQGVENASPPPSKKARGSLHQNVPPQSLPSDAANGGRGGPAISDSVPLIDNAEYQNYPLSRIPAPHANDVLCGRGGGTNNHAGNEKFRDLVNEKKRLYLNSSKREKPLVSKSIVESVRAQRPSGRFLQKDDKIGLWYDIGDQKAREKTSQALREGAPVIRREISSSLAMLAAQMGPAPRGSGQQGQRGQGSPPTPQQSHQLAPLPPPPLSHLGHSHHSHGPPHAQATIPPPHFAHHTSISHHPHLTHPHHAPHTGVPHSPHSTPSSHVGPTRGGQMNSGPFVSHSHSEGGPTGHSGPNGRPPIMNMRVS